MSQRRPRPLRWIAAASVSLAAIGCGLIATPPVPASGPNGAVSGSQSLSVAGRRQVQTGDTLVKVHFRDKQELQRLIDAGMDVWMVQDTYAAGTLPAGLLREAEKAGTKLELLTPRGYSIRSSYDPGYKTYAQLVPHLRGLAAKYPAICKLMDIGDTWEKTQGKADRDLLMLHITGKNPHQKPGIAFLGNHHARELVTVEVPLKLAELLLDSYGKDPELTELVDSRDIYILPMVNPDGHIHAEQGKSWRKNTNGMMLAGNPLEMGGYPGTDLNRNYGFKWGSGGASRNPSDETYMGQSAFSEPETRAVRDFFLKYRNIKVMMSYHSFSNLILYPWGHSKSSTPDAAKYTAIGKKLGSWSGYKPQSAADLYIASGITDDWTYGELGILSFTTEIGGWNDHFDPPFAKVNQFWNENRPGALYLIKLAGDANAAFGPDVSRQGDRIRFDGRVTGEAVAAEMFVGRLGAPGTGTPVQVGDLRQGLSLESLPPAASSGRVWVRARDAKGNWGTATAVRL